MTFYERHKLIIDFFVGLGTVFLTPVWILVFIYAWLVQIGEWVIEGLTKDA